MCVSMYNITSRNNGFNFKLWGWFPMAK
ncbi:hypothetical protein FWK35_00021453 [Aphis craccivora]|uniref:Uncharacterized protein n=1 Tax=Aphis craccivora TaxID=307492 RepID=A0A6G0YXZ6_APHCR|nr:hypothetical protein FWK35_00021453 [Aphis craccivora]